MVECPLIVQWVVRSIPHGEPIELFLVLVFQKHQWAIIKVEKRFRF